MTLDLRGALLLTPEQVAQMFGKPKVWVYRSAERGPLRPYVRRLGRQVFFHREGIEKFIAGST